MGFRWLVAAVLVALVDGSAMASDYEDGYIQGRESAKTDPAHGWLVIGGVSGCLAGSIGCLAASGAGLAIRPEVSAAFWTDDPQGDRWNEGFEDGYRSKLRQKRATLAFGAGAVGTAAFTAVLLSIAVSSASY